MWGSKRIGSLRAAKVIRHYMDPVLKIPLCDVVDSFGGVYMQCRTLNHGGGGPDSYEHNPPPVDTSNTQLEETLDETGDVMIALGDGRRPHATIVGTVYTPELAAQLTTDPQDTGENKDYGAKNTINDRVIKHRDVRVVLASSGTFLVDTKKTKKPIRLELDKQSFVRVSQEEKAEEHLLLAKATLQHVRAIHTRLDQLADAIATINASQINILGYLKTLLGGAALPPNLEQSIIDAVNVGLTIKASTQYPFDFAKTSTISDATDGGSDNLKAGCFRVSDVSVSTQGGS